MGCEHLQKVPLTMRPYAGRCERCGRESSPFKLTSQDSALHYWPLEHHELLEGNYLIQGCRRSFFTESEGEIDIAKEALERAYRSGWFAFRKPSSAPKAMFIRQTGLACIPGDSSIPCAFRSYHGYCNFPWYKGDEHSAKFSGTLAGFATGWPFTVAVDENDCEDIWLADKELFVELQRFPKLANYKDRFKVV